MASGLKVVAPATISNLNCGYDVLGAATEVICDEITGRVVSYPGVHLSGITGAGKALIPTDPAKNTALLAALKFLEYCSIRTEGIELNIHKKIPPGSGLGSSAASAVGAVVLANALFREPLSEAELLPLAILGEYAASSAAHADNVAPCLYGGITLVRDVHYPDVLRLQIPQGLHLTLVLPDIQVMTVQARSILRQDISLSAMVRQSANLGALVLGLERSDFDLIRRSLLDHVIEPQRAHLIPGFKDVMEAGHETGVLGCGISGSGPALFAMSDNSRTAEQAGIAMQKAFDSHGVTSEWHVSRINPAGASVL